MPLRISLHETDQIRVVYRAVREGMRTSEEIREFTGLSLKHCAAYLKVLENRGWIRRLRDRVSYRENSRGNIQWQTTEGKKGS